MVHFPYIGKENGITISSVWVSNSTSTPSPGFQKHLTFWQFILLIEHSHYCRKSTGSETILSRRFESQVKTHQVRPRLRVPSLCEDESCFPIGVWGSNLTSAQLYTVYISKQWNQWGWISRVKPLVLQTQYPHYKNSRNFKEILRKTIIWCSGHAHPLEAGEQCRHSCSVSSSPCALRLSPKLIQWPGVLFQKCIPEWKENSNADAQYEIFY